MIAWVLGFALIAFYIIPLIRKTSRINPDIFPIFRQIENYCTNYIFLDTVNPQEYERCKKVINLKKQAINSYGDYLADDYYKNLKRLNFDLPPLFIKNESPAKTAESRPSQMVDEKDSKKAPKQTPQ